MRIKALKSFTGLVTMVTGEERNVRQEIADDLINAGYAVAVETQPTEPAMLAVNEDLEAAVVSAEKATPAKKK